MLQFGFAASDGVLQAHKLIKGQSASRSFCVVHFIREMQLPDCRRDFGHAGRIVGGFLDVIGVLRDQLPRELAHPALRQTFSQRVDRHDTIKVNARLILVGENFCLRMVHRAWFE